ncbi:MAG: FKBP-type peptidyl-prolyl cis-trans isomerase [Balneola sp.]
MNTKLLFTLISLCLIFISCNKEVPCDSSTEFNVDQEQLNADISKIDNYLSNNSIDAQAHESGLRYVVNSTGDGLAPDVCSTVTVSYEGRLFDGEVFDSNENGVSFPLDRLIPGWQIGIPLIKSGGSITLYIPSVYAYGSAGSRNIPANSNLIFDINLTKVK